MTSSTRCRCGGSPRITSARTAPAIRDGFHSPRRTIDDTLAECRARVGRQFTAEAVAALEALHDNGNLAMAALRMHRPTPERGVEHAA